MPEVRFTRKGDTRSVVSENNVEVKDGGVNRIKESSGSSLNSAVLPANQQLESGAEGIRTPDLRRAKAALWVHSCSPRFKNPCKLRD
jgi:hypothetical protein